MTLTRAAADRLQEALPRSTTADPALKHSAAASTVTLGLASYIMPMTPIGTRTFRMWTPLYMSHSSMTSPTGSGRSDT